MSSLKYSLHDLIDLAVQFENGVERYYRYAADKNEKFRDIFLRLAEDEKRHAAIYQNLISHKDTENSIGRKEAAPYISVIIESEALQYLQGRKNFPEKADKPAEALKFALGVEKDTILFYYQIHEKIQEKKKNIVEKIIDEEKKHIEKIRQTYERLS